MNDFLTVNIVYLLMALILVCSGFMAVRQDTKKELKHALIWFVIIVVLCLGWAVFHPQSFPIPIHPSNISHDI